MQRTATQRGAETLTAASERLVDIAERRTAPRLSVALVARVVLVNDGARARPIETVTANISTSGALLKRSSELREGPWTIHLYLPGEGTPVTCDATLARATDSHIGIAFERVSAADEQRLAQLIEHEQRAQRRSSRTTASGPSTNLEESYRSSSPHVLA